MISPCKLFIAGATTIGAGYILKQTFTETDKVFPTFFKEFKLAEIKPLSHDTNVFKFSLPTSDSKTGIPLASPVLLKTPSGYIRPFTPIYNYEEGSIQFAIKNYNRSASKSIFEMKIGDSLKIAGPLPSVSLSSIKYKQVYLIGAGAGITPLWSFLNGTLNNPISETKFKLIYCNKSSNDVLFHKEINDLRAKFPDRFEFINILESNESADYNGRINKEILENELKIDENYHNNISNGEDIKVLVCGPSNFVENIAGKKIGPPFYQGCFGGILKDIGLKRCQVVKY